MKRRAIICVLVVALVALPSRALAEGRIPTTTVAELISAESGMEGRSVTFRAEVVSEVLAGGDGHAWINVLSDGAAIGVWVPRDLTSELEVFGDWRNTGDIVEVTGVFSEGCDIHGGDMDVHATEILLVTRGYERQHSISIWKLVVGLGGIALALFGYRRMRRLEEGDW